MTMSALGNIGSVVGTAAGTAFGGPVGGMIGGQLGGIAGNLIDKETHGNRRPHCGNDLRPRPCPPKDQCSPPDKGLTSDGRGTVDTGRYLIQAAEGELRIFDKETNTWVKVWGDPHLTTSDGDHASFTKDNLTIDLPDGTKVTMQPTKMENGVAYLDKVAIIKGNEAVEMSGLDPRDGQAVQIGNVLNNADAIDAKYADGSVFRAGKQVDDLTAARDGHEIVGNDPNGRWGEWNLDGMGGKSQLGTEGAKHPTTGGSNGSSTVGGADDSGELSAQSWKKIAAMIASGASIADILMAIAGQLEKGSRNVLTSYQALSEKLDKQNIADAKARENGEDIDPDAAGRVSEADLKAQTQQLQQLQDLIQQLTQAATNIQKAYHDTNMATVSNLK